MPQLFFRGVEHKDIAKASLELPDKLAKICNTTPDNFIFEASNSTFYENGKEINLYPLIEVKMFDRGREVEKEMYNVIDEFLHSRGYKELEVYFIKLQKESYYY